MKRRAFLGKAVATGLVAAVGPSVATSSDRRLKPRDQSSRHFDGSGAKTRRTFLSGDQGQRIRFRRGYNRPRPEDRPG